MGSLIGHIVPGTFFGLFAMWWTFDFLRVYFRSEPIHTMLQAFMYMFESGNQSLFCLLGLRVLNDQIFLLCT